MKSDAPPPGSDAVARLLARVSHEIRGPLNGIIGGVELLKDTSLSGDQRRYMELITSGSETLLEVLGRLPELVDPPEAPAKPAGKPVQKEPAGRKERVLVAEESRINQLIAVEQLGRLGLKADAVGSAAEMREKLASGVYSALMIDCRLPDADPCMVAVDLRRQEPAGQRLKIIAVAPESRAGERDRCLAAGMDGYIAKPLRLENLRELFAPDTSAPAPAFAEGTVDLGQVESLRAESPDLLERLIRLFEESVHKTLAEMREAAGRGDRRSIAAAAHMLKGSASNFGAHRMMEACQLLEEAVNLRSGRVEKYLDALADEYQLVDKALRACANGKE